MNRNDEEYEIDLLHLLQVLWQKAWLIIVSAVLAGALLFSYAFFMVTPKYESSVLIYVNNLSDRANTSGYYVSTTELTAAKSLVSTYIVILKSPSTIQKVIEKSGVHYTEDQLLKMIDAKAVDNTEIFEVKVTSTNPQEAANIANTVAVILPDAISSVMEGSSARVVDYAVANDKKVSPSYTKYTAIGALLGIVLSAAVVIVADLTDTVIRSEDDLSVYNIPLLASIPDLTARSSDEYGYYARSSKKSKGGDD